MEAVAAAGVSRGLVDDPSLYGVMAQAYRAQNPNTPRVYPRVFRPRRRASTAGALLRGRRRRARLIVSFRAFEDISV
eukprot:3768693-Lingulodinium_polyedra.AAC.1